MRKPESFKKPTIKATSRAYVRLFGYFSSPSDWLDFLERYQVKCPVPFDRKRV